MLHSLITFWSSLKISQSRLRRLPGILAARMPPEGRVLDVGAGNGAIAHAVSQAVPGLTITGVDVIPQPNPLIPIEMFDGEHLPFEDGSFDMVTLVDVLHHCDTPRPLLAEALRVSRGRVLVKDHYWISHLDRWVLCFSDYLGNTVQGVHLPYRFLRPEQWEALFADLGVRCLDERRFQYGPHDWGKQVTFLLAKADPGS